MTARGTRIHPPPITFPRHISYACKMWVCVCVCVWRKRNSEMNPINEIFRSHFHRYNQFSSVCCSTVLIWNLMFASSTATDLGVGDFEWNDVLHLPKCVFVFQSTKMTWIFDQKWLNPLCQDTHTHFLSLACSQSCFFRPY